MRAIQMTLNPPPERCVFSERSQLDGTDRTNLLPGARVDQLHCAQIARQIKGEMMAVGIRLKLTGVTAEQMDKLNAAIDPDGNPPDGIIFHASGPVDGGWGVIDFWQSREQFDRFQAERIGPAMAAIGATGAAPEVHEFPVHEHFPR
jgi:hypothetical protein